MQDLGPLQRYLGVYFLATPQGILVHQKSYTLRLADQYNFLNCKNVSTPLSENLTRSFKTHTPTLDSILYCLLVGKLINLPYQY